MCDKNSKADFLVGVAYLAVVAGIFYFAFQYVLEWLLPLVLGLIIAALARPAALALSRRTGIGEQAAGTVVLLIVYLLAALLAALFGAAAVRLAMRAAQGLPAFYAQTLRPALLALEQLLGQLFGRLFPGGGYSLEALAAEWQDRLVALSANAAGWLGGAASRVPSCLMTFFFTVVCSLLISASYSRTTAFILRQLPPRARRILLALRESFGSAAVGYVKAELGMMLVTFCELLLGLLLLRIEGFWKIALLIALLDAVPVLGAGCVLLPWAAMEALRGNMPLAAGLALLYGICAVVHNALEPRLVGSQLGINPLVSVCAIYLGHKLLGVPGMIVAPICAYLLIGLHRAGVLGIWREG